MNPQKMQKTQNSFRIKTQHLSTTELLNERSKYHRYDYSLYHKTNFHLKPLKENPSLYTKVQSESIAARVKKTNARANTERNESLPVCMNKMQKQKKEQNKKTIINVSDGKKSINQLAVFNNANNSKQGYIMLPQTMNIRSQLTKIAGLERALQKILEEDTKMLVTAKKWVIFDMESNQTLKGYKQKKAHDVASLTKILTFYTAYMIIQRYYLMLEKMELMVEEADEKIQGTKINIKKESLVTLEDMLFAMMLNSANNAATVIANNLGSYVLKKREGKYFSCFDIPNEDREKNIGFFLQLMNTYASELKLENSTFSNVHGMCSNLSSARDMAILISECYKIPLFSKIVLTRYHTLRIKYVADSGELEYQQIALKNTNKLLWLKTGCIGGKTGCNSKGGQSLAACYEGNIIIVVLGCAGREEKFADAEKLIGWLYKKLRAA